MKPIESEPFREENPDVDLRTLEEFVDEHTCGIDKKPEWCVYGSAPDGSSGVLYWIKPGGGDEFVARKLAQMVSKLGGAAQAEMTEWNPKLDGRAVYENSWVDADIPPGEYS